MIKSTTISLRQTRGERADPEDSLWDCAGCQEGYYRDMGYHPFEVDSGGDDGVLYLCGPCADAHKDEPRA